MASTSPPRVPWVKVSKAWSIAWTSWEEAVISEAARESGPKSNCACRWEITRHDQGRHRGGSQDNARSVGTDSQFIRRLPVRLHLLDGGRCVAGHTWTSAGRRV